jgi:uncharacterized OsmC-like protein
MNDTDLVINSVSTVSSGMPGRTIAEVRNHFVVVDDPSIGESMTAADHFITGIAGCASNHMEIKARNDGIPLRRIEVRVEARRDRMDTSVFVGIEFNITFFGVTAEEAHELLESYQRHCPLYKAAAAVTTVTLSTHVEE